MKKNIMKVFMMLVLLIVVPAALTSCDLGGGSESKKTEEQIVLSEEENTVLIAVSNSLTDFKNPSSVRVIAVSTSPFIGGRYVKISAENSFGGNVVDIFQVSLGSLRGPIDDLDYFESDPEISVANINKMLKEYKLAMGW